MPTDKLTPAMLRVLAAAVKDRSIVIGGLDATPGVRMDVVRRLAAAGLLRWVACADPCAKSEWKPTEAGRAALAQAGHTDTDRS